MESQAKEHKIPVVEVPIHNDEHCMEHIEKADQHPSLLVPLHHTGAVLAPVVADGCHWKLSLGPPSTEACQPLSYHLSLFSSFFLVNAASSAVVPTTVNIVSLARETLLSPAKSSPSDGLSPIHASNTILYSPGTWK